ncbi:MAG TPA: hypothetical protein VJ063_06735 [Verrucomicrobiae bacterium]|nr:hypothetical protein [Verrucomicrobiae bacterium]
MKTDTFTPRFASALLENVIVLIGITVGTPIAMLSRKASHPGMTVAYAVKAGLIGGVLSLLFYTVRFVLRVPRTIIISESDLLLRWRNGKETRVRWDDVRRAVFRERWGYRWKFFLDDSTPILWGDGFSAATWEQMSDLVVAQLSARSVPMEKYDLYGKRAA